MSAMINLVNRRSVFVLVVFHVCAFAYFDKFIYGSDKFCDIRLTFSAASCSELVMAWVVGVTAIAKAVPSHHLYVRMPTGKCNWEII